MITILSTKEFLSMPKVQDERISEIEFLKKYFITDDNDCNGWKFRGQFTTDIEVAKEWFKNIK